VRFEVGPENVNKFGISLIPNLGKKLSKMTREWPKNEPKNVRLATCFKNPENSGFYPRYKPKTEHLRASMPINKEWK
jgi:hypothetical protein